MESYIIKPQGKRTKNIVIKSIYQQSETEQKKQERDEVLAKNFLNFGLKKI